jgi:hypothetical protein
MWASASTARLAVNKLLVEQALFEPGRLVLESATIE